MIKAIEDVLSVDIPNLVSQVGKKAGLPWGLVVCVPTRLPQGRPVCEPEMTCNR